MSAHADLLAALDGLLDHAEPANVAELEKDDPDQFAAWQRARAARAKAKEEPS